MRPSGTLHNRIPRRIFFRNAGLGAAVIAGLPFLARSCSETGCGKRISSYFSPGDVILFQGDSITDAGRNRERELPNDAWSFGTGYAMLIASWLLEELAQKELTIYNRGISGNKVFQLAERWDKDCLFLHPDVLSILIGVNDYWHMLQGSYEGTADTYENDYRALLKRTKEKLPGIKLVIILYDVTRYPTFLNIPKWYQLVYDENPSLAPEDIEEIFSENLGINEYFVYPDPLGEYHGRSNAW